MNGLTPSKTTGVADWPTGAPQRAARGAPQPSEPFAGILDAHQARTAPAEGQTRNAKAREHDARDEGPVANDRAEARSNAQWARDRRAADGIERERPQHKQAADDDAPPTPDPDPAPAAQPVDGTTPPANGGSQPDDPQTPDAGTSGDPSQTPGTGAPAEEQPAAPANADAGPAAPVQQQAPVATAAATPQQLAEAAAAAQQQQPGASAAADSAVQVTPSADAAATKPLETADESVAPQAGVPGSGEETGPVQGRTDGSSQSGADGQGRSNGSANGHFGSHAGGSQQQPGDRQPGTLPAQASDQARTVAQAFGRVHQQQPQAPVATQPSGTPPVVAAPVANADLSARGALGQATPVPLARAAENVEHVLRLAANRGVTHARITLNPEQLGSIDVHMRHTADGIVARVVAHAPEAVQQLQQAVADLRRALEGQGLNLLNLDIGHSGDEAGRAGADSRDDRGRSKGAQDADGAVADTATTSTLQLPNGVLVDVLA